MQKKPPFLQDPVLNELKAIRAGMRQILSEVRNERGATVEQLKAVFVPIIKKLRGIDRKVKNQIAKGETP